VESSAATVIATLTNVAIGTAKLLVGAVGGSSAMIAEGFHSVVDTADQLLTFRAHRVTRRRADGHAFLDARDAHYTSLAISLVVFGAGAGVAFVSGLARLAQGVNQEVGAAGWSYAVLGAAAVFQGVSWIVGVRKAAQAPGAGWLSRPFQPPLDPASRAVLAQDTAALVGLLLAWLGIIGDRVLGLHVLDPIASMCIGLLVAGMGLVLARERKGLLMGEGAGSESIQRVRRAIAAEASVASVGDVRVLQVGPDELMVTCEVEFRRDLAGAPVHEAIDRVEEAVRSAEPRASHVFVGVERSSPTRPGPGDPSPGASATLT
jgi:cation diffusion facilitator family transporter